jgi:hypothetical protein
MEEALVEPRGPKICLRARYRGGVGVEVEYLSLECTQSGPGVDPEWTAFGLEWVVKYISKIW